MQVLGWDVGISLFPSVSKPLGYFQVMLFKNSFIIKRVRHLLYQQISDFYMLSGQDLRFYQVCHLAWQHRRRNGYKLCS